MCYNKSMKRIDVLKGIEQILVQKAYETGHISHRADGDWQKQADGSWTPYKGQSNQSTPQTQKPTKNTEYGGITEEDLNNNITTSLNSLDSDERVKMSPKQQARHLLKNGDYDSAIKQIDFEEDDDGVPFTYDNDFELIVDNVMNDMGMSGEERKVNRGAISRAIMDRALQLRKPAEYDADQVDLSGYANNINIDSDDEDYEDDVEKSVFRDMQSAPTTKNMGF